MKTLLITVIAIASLVSCQGQKSQYTLAKDSKKQHSFKIKKTDQEWRAQLSEMQYYILRQAGTERPFTGSYNDFKREGTFLCAACATPLYESKHKFDSGTGWPSFWQGVEGNIVYDVDHKIGYARTELLCATCGGHLGHVFNDGPPPTGKRHCINSASLLFERSATK